MSGFGFLRPALAGLILLLASRASTPAAEPVRLAAGPMLGYTGARDAAVWVMTDAAGSVSIAYRPEGRAGSGRQTPAVRTTAADDFAATIRVTGLAPDTTYLYDVLLDGRTLPQARPLTFRTAPLWSALSAPSDATIAFGSCNYVNDPETPGDVDGGGYEIFRTMAGLKPDLMLWLGDNFYLREGDLDSASAMRRRARLTRTRSELRELFAATRNLATWDDHDYGPNDGDASWPLKEDALRLHELYWPPALRYGAPGAPGVFQTFRWSDLQFFLLDDRWYRKPDRWPPGPDKVQIGRAQLDWLKESLAFSTATFKLIVVGGQALNPNTRFESWASYPGELRELVEFLKSARVEGVVFLTGDRHWSEILRRDEPGLYPLYDFTSSPLTSKPRPVTPDDPELGNPLRVPGALLRERGFGLVRVEGTAADRKLVLEARDASGAVRFRHEVPHRELTLPPAR